MFRAGKNASLRIARKRMDSNYIDYHVNIFKYLGAKRSDGKIYDKRTDKVCGRTMLHTTVNMFLQKYIINGIQMDIRSFLKIYR
jgi:hypothetical protein